MSSKEQSFAERLLTAAKAKQAQLAKIRAIPLAGEAQSAKRHAERVKISEAREIRTAERKKVKRIAAQLKHAQRAADEAAQAQAVDKENARKDADRVTNEAAAAVLAKD